MTPSAASAARGRAIRTSHGAPARTDAAPAPALTPTEPPPDPRPRWPRRLTEFPAAQEAPVSAEVLRVGRGSFGLGMEFRVRLTNRDAARTVDAVRFDVWCFDNFDELVPNRSRFGAPPSFGMISQETIAPGRSDTGVWSEHLGADTCTRARVWLTQVHFADGSTWEATPLPPPTGQ
ncbi:MAG: hypothetical protein U0324_39820 [Polyangiales bacterium]